MCLLSTDIVLGNSLPGLSLSTEFTCVDKRLKRLATVLCHALCQPMDEIEELVGGIQINFQKDIYIGNYLKSLDLNERQIPAVLFTKREK
jgi:hypothetical protein